MSDEFFKDGGFTMSEHDLELLITLDDPEGAPEEDRFHNLHADNGDRDLSLQLPPWRVA